MTKPACGRFAPPEIDRESIKPFPRSYDGLLAFCTQGVKQ